MGEAKRKKAAANIPSPFDNDRRRINDDLVMVYQEGLSEAYRCASVEAAKAIHNSGLSHKEQLDLVINVLHNLMTHSPNGYAAELEALDKHLKKMPHNYLEDVELYINRQMKNHPDSRAKISSDPEKWTSTYEGPVGREVTEHCVYVLKQLLNGLPSPPEYRLSFLVMSLAYFIADKVEQPEDFVDQTLTELVKALVVDYRQPKSTNAVH